MTADPEWTHCVKLVHCQRVVVQERHCWLRLRKLPFSTLRYWKVEVRVNDPSAGSPTETLLRLLLPLSDKVY